MNQTTQHHSPAPRPAPTAGHATAWRRCALALALALIAVAGVACGTGAPAGPPNIVVVMVDDLGYSDVGFAAAPGLKTPALSAIAKSGYVMTNAYATYSICTGARIGFHTGQYPNRHKDLPFTNYKYDPDDPAQGLPAPTHILSEQLQGLGYHTGAIGKWHMGATPEQHPLAAGFDYFYGFTSGGHNYWPPEQDLKRSRGGSDHHWYNLPLQENHELRPLTKYLTDDLSDRAVSFVERAAAAEQPFYLYLSYNAPHSPYERPPLHYLMKVPYEADQPAVRRTYLAMVRSVDAGLERVLSALRRSGELDNTLIVFVNDNGIDVRSEVLPSDNRPFRGGKAQLLEGGVRVPMVVSWPARWEGGRTYDGVVSVMDILPTLRSAAGGGPATETDGIDLTPYLDGTATQPDRTLFWHSGKLMAVRNGEHKVIQTPDERVLYNLAQDPGETVDLSDQLPETYARLYESFRQWCRDLRLKCA